MPFHVLSPCWRLAIIISVLNLEVAVLNWSVDLTLNGFQRFLSPDIVFLPVILFLQYTESLTIGRDIAVYFFPLGSLYLYLFFWEPICQSLILSVAFTSRMLLVSVELKVQASIPYKWTGVLWSSKSSGPDFYKGYWAAQTIPLSSFNLFFFC